jgi:hypothetical protein
MASTMKNAAATAIIPKFEMLSATSNADFVVSILCFF